MYYVVTLDEIKRWLDISGTSKDAILTDFQKAVTSLMERFCGKQFITRRYVEYIDVEKQYQSELLLSFYPVYVNAAGDNFTIWNDPERQFPDSTKISDYILESDIGRVKLVNGYFLRGRGSVKADYWAGYSRFVVLNDANDKFRVTEGSTTYTVDVAEGTYIAEDLATAIQTAIANSGATYSYTVKYDHVTQKFTISANSTFSLTFNVADSIGGLIGFTSDKSDSSSYDSDEARTGLPAEITVAAQQIIHRWYRLSKEGEGGLDLVREIVSEVGTREYDTTWVPSSALKTLERYKRAYL